jgi:hypothetical protein
MKKLLATVRNRTKPMPDMHEVDTHSCRNALHERRPATHCAPQPGLTRVADPFRC